MGSTHQQLYPRALVRDEIRVLYIDAVSPDIIHLRLITATLNDIDYIALSWCWNEGDTSQTAVVINGLTINVQANVVSMLRHMHELSQDLNLTGLPFWLDTVCINQTDADEPSRREKATQIKLQGQVYARAKSVLVWLGLAANGSRSFMNVLQYLTASITDGPGRESLEDHRTTAQRCLQDHDITQATLHSIADMIKHEPVNRDRLVPQGLESYNHPLWQAWTAFASRPWFGRQWILQEFILCPSTTIVCGHDFVDWRALLLWTTRNLQPHAKSISQDMFERLQRDHGKVHMLAKQREQTQASSHDMVHSLDDLLRTMAFRGAKATRVHDLIYGLLGLVDKATRDEITVDYDISPAEVFMTAMKLACFTGQPAWRAALMWESHAMRGNMGIQAAQHVCSWCPNLRNTQLNIRGDSVFSRSLSRASAMLDRDQITTAKGRPGFDRLTVQLDVIIVDSITQVCTGPFVENGPLDNMAFIVQALRRPSAAWLQNIADLWRDSQDPLKSRSLFMEDFFSEPHFSRFAVEDRVALYEQLQRFVQTQTEGLDDRQAIMTAMTQACRPGDPYSDHIGASLSQLRSHAASTYCLTEARQFGRCMSQTISLGDIICIVPGAEWLHVFREIGNTAGTNVYRRVGIAWFSRWSEAGETCSRTQRWQTLEIQ